MQIAGAKRAITTSARKNKLAKPTNSSKKFWQHPSFFFELPYCFAKKYRPITRNLRFPNVRQIVLSIEHALVKNEKKELLRASNWSYFVEKHEQNKRKIMYDITLNSRYISCDKLRGGSSICSACYALKITRYFRVNYDLLADYLSWLR